VFVSNTNYDNIATSMQILHEMQVLADRYINDPTQEDPVWLHAQMDGETGVRRALVRRIEVQYKPQWFGVGESTLNIPEVITVVREPYWENPTVMRLPDISVAATANMIYDYTSAGAVISAHDIVGDVGARIRHFRLWSSTTALATCWFGIRSANKHPNLANFIALWECEDGTNFPDATDAAEGAASGGTRVTISESAVDWDDGAFHPAVELLVSDVTANPTDNLGKFLWLLRARLATSGAWEVRLRFSYDRSGSEQNFGYIETDPVEITTNNYLCYEMGISPIGIRDIQTILTNDLGATFETDFRVDIYARRTSGTSDLYLDCLLLIPIDEGFCKIDVNNPNTNSVALVFGVSPKGTADVLSFSSALNKIRDSTGLLNLENFVLPPGDGRMYIVAQEEDVHDLTASITMNDADIGKYYERWLSLRGSE
jgi:hypothetical protein